MKNKTLLENIITILKNFTFLMLFLYLLITYKMTIWVILEYLKFSKDHIGGVTLNIEWEETNLKLIPKKP